jgi:hypothetical protein
MLTIRCTKKMLDRLVLCVAELTLLPVVVPPSARVAG